MESKKAASVSGHEFSNRLCHEKSPYLLQHAHNPVDWYPWGEEALQRSVDEDKLILVSIGYSTCHWCHVMEVESFEDRAVADFMNRNFICIKVDREERPDLDQIYITAVTSMTGSAGWPLNVFLTPNRLPFFGGTYFPPRSTVGMSSWLQVLEAVANAWENSAPRKKIESAADEVFRVLQRVLDDDSCEQEIKRDLPEKAAKGYAAIFDEKQGGFSGAPKFPSPAIQSFLLHYSRISSKSPVTARTLGDRAREMATETLRFMARGGIYDQIGGGFHRYATDDRWFVPHFEKMLYDNAQLIVNYLEAHQTGGGEFFLSVALETADYLMRDMQHPDGGFYSAEDADSMLPEDGRVGNGKKVEGAFYTWKEDMIRTALEDSLAADLFCYRYGAVPGGNVAIDPHGYFRHKNILYRSHSIAESAARFEMTTVQAEDLLRLAKGKLLVLRNQRSRPHLDDKILTDWNGLAISAMAKVHRVTRAEKYLDAGVRAARFIREHLYDPSSGMLFRRWRAGERKIEALATDYAFFIQGLIDLFEADAQPDWLRWAVELTEHQMKWFYQPDRGVFYMTRPDHDPYLIIRPREAGDSVIPSAASVSVLNLQRLSVMTGKSAYFQTADRIIRQAAGQMDRYPMGSPLLLKAVMETFEPSRGNPFGLERSGHL
jgi:uncharacterized protein YyaL (SSP411 family)